MLPRGGRCFGGREARWGGDTCAPRLPAAARFSTLHRQFGAAHLGVTERARVAATCAWTRLQRAQCGVPAVTRGTAELTEWLLDSAK